VLFTGCRGSLIHAPDEIESYFPSAGIKCREAVNHSLHFYEALAAGSQREAAYRQTNQELVRFRVGIWPWVRNISVMTVAVNAGASSVW
jgi:hypothetical protein